jgi:hypothetical protein
MADVATPFAITLPYYNCLPSRRPAIPILRVDVIGQEAVVLKDISSSITRTVYAEDIGRVTDWTTQQAFLVVRSGRAGDIFYDELPLFTLWAADVGLGVTCERDAGVDPTQPEVAT